jgi:hypothetical protein
MTKKQPTETAIRNWVNSGQVSDRRRAALSPRCPTDLLEKLATDKNNTVRSNAARNANCTADLLDNLANDISNNVRRRVAAHKNCPRIALERLLKDRNWPVVLTAVSNGRCPDNLGKKAIQRFAKKCSIKVRKDAAKDWGNEFLQSRDLVKALAADKSPIVRKALAGNPRCPSSLYKQLLNDKDDAVRKAAALNAGHPVNDHLIRTKPTSSPWLQAQLAKAEADFPGITVGVQEGKKLFRAPKTDKALRSGSLLGRIIALSQLNAPPAELARASGYRDWRQLEIWLHHQRSSRDSARTPTATWLHRLALLPAGSDTRAKRCIVKSARLNVSPFRSITSD